jgi:hypothetical protein
MTINRAHIFSLIAGTALVCALSGAQAAAPFDATLNLHGILFRVTSANSATGNSVTVQPTGLTIDNSPVVWPAAGTVVRAEVADINADLSQGRRAHGAKRQDTPASIQAGTGRGWLEAQARQAIGVLGGSTGGPSSGYDAPAP